MDNFLGGGEGRGSDSDSETSDDSCEGGYVFSGAVVTNSDAYAAAITPATVVACAETSSGVTERVVLLENGLSGSADEARGGQGLEDEVTLRAMCCMCMYVRVCV